MLADNAKGRLWSGIIIAASVVDTQAAIVCMVTKDLTNIYNAGEIVSYISNAAGGKGGGKPEMAPRGTRDIEKLHSVFVSSSAFIKKNPAGYG